MLLSFSQYKFFMVCFDPLAQFEIINFVSLKPFFLSNFTVFLSYVLLIITVSISISKWNTNNNWLSSLLHNLIYLVNNIINDNTNLKRKQYFISFFYLFLFIFFANFTGLMPFSWAITNSFVVTFFLSYTYFFYINFMCVWNKGWGFVNLFLPSGVPFMLAPLIFLIEFVSYFARVFSLSIRLFANISSGHALLKILIGFSWAILLNITNYSSIFFFLEVLISFLQTYVFVVLLSIYINDVSSEH